jgi:hypothetical protein
VKTILLCSFCDDAIDIGDTAICKNCVDELHKNIKKLQARIAELEAAAIVWHRYPEEKPDRPMGKMVNRLVDWFTMLILYKDKNGNRFVGRDTYHWWKDDDPSFEVEIDESITVIGFAYMPAPPDEVSND